MEKVLIDSIRQPGHTKLVAPVFADILTTMNLYRRVEVTAAPTAAARGKRKGTYRRRDLVAEELSAVPDAPSAPPVE